MKLFSRRPVNPVSDGYSLIDEQLSIAGGLSSTGTVRVEGRVEGPLHRAGKLIVGEGATIVGDVEAHEIIVAGSLTGNLRVTGRVEIQASATVRGDIHAAAVMLHDGGTVHGHLLVHSIEGEQPPAGGERRLASTPIRAVAAVSQS